MKIDIYSKKYAPNTEATRLLRAKIKANIDNALALTGISKESIGKIVIADRNIYGQTIATMLGDKAQESNHTDNEIFIGVAKTICQNIEGEIVNTVVYETSFIDAIPKFDIKKINFLNTETQRFFYVLAHEAGHCKDHLIRVDQENVSIHKNRFFKIKQVNAYYTGILISEFAACVYSAKAMTQAAFEIEVTEWRDNTFSLLNKAFEEYANYQRTHSGDDLRRLAFTSSGCFWTILIQYAKLIGSKIGNSVLQSDEFSNLFYYPGVNKLLDDLENTLVYLWEKYPNWAVGDYEPLAHLWDKMALLWHFRFDEGIAGDGLFFDHNEKIVGNFREFVRQGELNQNK